jgi:hypothetical protein
MFLIHYIGGSDGHRSEHRSFHENQLLKMQFPPYEDATMQQPTNNNDHMYHIMMMQMNQQLLALLSQRIDPNNKRDSKVRPKPFTGLPTEDVLTWLDYFENVAGYHDWPEERKAAEARTVLEGIAVTWYIQPPQGQASRKLCSSRRRANGPATTADIAPTKYGTGGTICRQIKLAIVESRSRYV